jgi:hypothetical protein
MNAWSQTVEFWKVDERDEAMVVEQRPFGFE